MSAFHGTFHGGGSEVLLGPWPWREDILEGLIVDEMPQSGTKLKESARVRTPAESAARKHGVARAQTIAARHFSSAAQRRKKAARKAAKRARARNR